ncbi:hypothetical protein [Dongia sp. agr-C8]
MSDGADHRFALKLLAWIAGIWLAGMALLIEAAALPPEASGSVIVLYPIGTNSAAAVAASAAAGAKLVSASWFDNVLVVADDAPGLAGRLEEQGALAVFENMSFASFSFAGCIGATARGN